MRIELKIGEFNSHLRAHLRAVRRGQEIVIKDRETPIARVVPHEAPARRLVARRPTIPLKNITRLPGIKIKLKSGELDNALRQTRMDYFDKWPARRLT